MENNIKKQLIEFEKKYNINEKVIVNYIDALKVNDTPSLQTYNIIMYTQCPSNLIEDMKKDLKNIIKNPH